MIGKTVAEAKDILLNAVKGAVFGNVCLIPSDLVNYWNDDSHVVENSSTYSVINVNPGYDGDTYAQFMLFNYNNYDAKFVGRNNNTWTSIKTFAYTNSGVGYLNKSILTNQNIDSIKDHAFKVYYGLKGNTCTGKPANVDGFTLQVWGTEDAIHQILYTNSYIYKRSYYDGQWHSWGKVLFEGDVTSGGDSDSTSTTTHIVSSGNLNTFIEEGKTSFYYIEKENTCTNLPLSSIDNAAFLISSNKSSKISQ